MDLELLLQHSKSDILNPIIEKVYSNQRINTEEGIALYEKAPLSLLGVLANYVRETKHGNNTYFNRNFHIEPTNICIYDCTFCSYKRNLNEEDAWEYQLQDILNMVKSYEGKAITEVHIVGGVHPRRNLEYYGNMLSKIKELRPDLHIKGFTAVELEFMIRKSGYTIKEGLKRLKEYGLDSIPGGGAEIFDEKIRKTVCGAKSTSKIWLEIHETAHQVGLPSNATILYGHIENYSHRIDHLKQLRDLQDRTGGFNTFIPLKYRKENNHLSHIGEVTTSEDLRNYAVSRIFLDNIPHLKAYWPMIGQQTTQLALSFGVDDIDGTIDDSTKIYSMAGVEEQKPTMNTQQLVSLVHKSGRDAVERDTLYNAINFFPRN